MLRGFASLKKDPEALSYSMFVVHVHLLTYEGQERLHEEQDQSYREGNDNEDQEENCHTHPVQDALMVGRDRVLKEIDHHLIFSCGKLSEDLPVQ